MAGRPPKIDKVVATDRETGADITAGQMVINRVRATWAPWESAAASAGISRQTLHTWRKAGALARAKAALGQHLSRNERLYAAFLDDLERAEEEAHLRALGTVQRAAGGGTVLTKTVTKTVGGKVVEKVVTETEQAPQWTAAAWLLERRRQNDYALRRLELTGAGGEPLLPKEERADDLAAALEGFLAGADAQAQRQEDTHGVGATARPDAGTEEATDGA